MEIKYLGLSRGDSISREQSSKPSKTARNIETNYDTDEVIISSGREGGGVSGSTYSVKLSGAIRTDNVARAVERLNRGEYQGDTLSKTGEILIESPGIRDTVTEVAVIKRKPSDVRSESVERAKERTSSDYYTQPEILRNVAENLIEAFGLKK